MPRARVCGVANTGNVGGRAEMDGAVRPPPFLPCCPVPGQNLTRSLGRQASPEPFLLLSGAGTPACQRGSGPGGRQSSWAHPGCMAGARAPSLVPVLPVVLVPSAMQEIHHSSPRQGTQGQEPLPSWPGRQKVAGAQPTLCQGLVGHQLSARSLPSSGHGQGNGGKSQRWP